MNQSRQSEYYSLSPSEMPLQIIYDTKEFIYYQSGGILSNNGPYTLLSFTKSGNLNISTAGKVVYYIIVGGGGGGSAFHGGSGGKVQSGNLSVNTNYTLLLTVGQGGNGYAKKNNNNNNSIIVQNSGQSSIIYGDFYQYAYGGATTERDFRNSFTTMQNSSIKFGKGGEGSTGSSLPNGVGGPGYKWKFSDASYGGGGGGISFDSNGISSTDSPNGQDGGGNGGRYDSSKKVYISGTDGIYFGGGGGGASYDVLPLNNPYQYKAGDGAPGVIIFAWLT